MPAELDPWTGPAPRRARYLIPEQLPRRGEIAAACVVLLLAAHLLFAQLTFLLVVVFTGIGKATRWRPSWLVLPAAAGVVWTLAIGPAAAAAGFAAGPSRIFGYLGAHGALHVHGAFDDAGSWLPLQFPLALIAAAAEAALVCWLEWFHTDEWAVRPARSGFATAVRRAVTTRAIRGGSVVTRDGATLGVAPATGARAALSWAEVAGGVLFAGAAGRDITATGFQLLHAALRLRKPVIVLDLTSDPALGSALAAACPAAGTPLRTFGTENGSYEPFRDVDAARRTKLVLALLGGDSRAAQLPLRTAFELMTAVPADAQVPVLDDVLHLLNPMAARARLRLVARDSPLAARLGEQVQAAAHLAKAEPEAVTAVARRLAEIRSSADGGWLRPADGGHPDIDLARVIRDRSAALFRPDTPWMARLVCADLLALGDDLRRLEVDGDAVVVLCGCEKLPAEMVGRLVDSGATAGLPVLATTTSAPAAAGLAEVFGTLVIHRLVDADGRAAAASLSARTGTRPVPAGVAAADGPGSAQGLEGGVLDLVARPVVSVRDLLSLRTGQFTVAVQSPRQRLVALGAAVPARLPRSAPATGRAAAVETRAVARLRAGFARSAAKTSAKTPASGAEGAL
ncbi:MAG TPA: hypothetical protein VF060_10515 [Trebonia sp.]